MSTKLGYYAGGKRIDEAKNVPVTEHWAVVETDYYSTDHGYPESGYSRYSYLRYYAFEREQDWRAAVTDMLKEQPGRTDIRAFHVKPVNPSVDVEVKVKF